MCNIHNSRVLDNKINNIDNIKSGFDAGLKAFKENIKIIITVENSKNNNTTHNATHTVNNFKS